ncbi:MAG: hypothetical protein HQ462_11340 [Deltaproteobacteria bacterium]|nr:hypothetical protein [Deltaproteobacteria bacterium]
MVHQSHFLRAEKTHQSVKINSRTDLAHYNLHQKINTHRLEQGWANSIATVANAPEFKTAFDGVLKNMTKLEKSFK